MIAAVAALAIVVTACGDDKKSDSTNAASTASSAAANTASSTATGDSTANSTAGSPAVSPEAAVKQFDSNGDGKVVIGIATAGPANDGGYYQALVDKTKAVSTQYGFSDPIVVDKIKSDAAATELSNLAEQKVDIILVGASSLGAPLKDLTTKYDKIFWYCNCGAGQPAMPGLAQSTDDSSEISYTAGYATGLLLKANGGTKSVFIGASDENFEKEAYLAFELGLQAVDASFTNKYVPSGNFPYDFDNTTGATEALNAAIADGSKAVYPFLGGAHEPVVKLANEKNVIVMSAGSSKACARTDLKYDIQVRFDAGDYLDTIFNEMLAGTFKEGDIRVFKVGIDPQPGAQICKPTADQQAAMDAVYKDIAAGKLAAKFGEIKGKAYSGG